MRLVWVVLLVGGCGTFVPWRVPPKGEVDRCLDSGGCWNYRDNLCERVDPARCPDPDESA